MNSTGGAQPAPAACSSAQLKCTTPPNGGLHSPYSPTAHTRARRAARRALAGCSPRLHYVDCANPLLLTPAGTINGSLVPDALHPSPAGYETIFSGCWDAAIAGLVANATAVPVE